MSESEYDQYINFIVELYEGAEVIEISDADYNVPNTPFKLIAASE